MPFFEFGEIEVHEWFGKLTHFGLAFSSLNELHHVGVGHSSAMATKQREVKRTSTKVSGVKMLLGSCWGSFYQAVHVYTYIEVYKLLHMIFGQSVIGGCMQSEETIIRCRCRFLLL